MDVSVSYMTSVRSQSLETHSLEDVLMSIQGKDFETAIGQIRAASNPAERKEKKLELLPAFYPTLLLGSENRLDELSQPTGIVQFDIDLKDNPDLDIALFRNRIEQVSSTIYAFESPSGGLKFGMLTDFHRHDEESEVSVMERYKMAYERVLDNLRRLICMQFVDDGHVRSIKMLCYVSSDAKTFYNPDCDVFDLDASCVYHPPMLTFTGSDNQVTDDQVMELLSYVPHDFSYADRFKINMAVLSKLGVQGIAVLKKHWTTADRKKLQKNLNEQLVSFESGAGYGSIGYLVKQAKKYGWAKPSGKVRKTVLPKSVDVALPALLSPEDAESRLTDLLQLFFSGKKSLFINFSTGAGKTYFLIKALEQLDFTSNILFLVQTHDLADQIERTFEEVRKERLGYLPYLEQLRAGGFKSQIVHLKGKALRCENREATEFYKSAGINSIPSLHCTEACHFQADCRYTFQFESIRGNIRVMTHNEYLNDVQSKWFSGVNEYGEPNPNRWIPDYIIIDENILTKGPDDLESTSPPFTSIAKIVSAVHDGQGLPEAIMTYKWEVQIDGVKNRKPRRPSFTTPAEYVDGMKAYNKESKAYSPLIDNLVSYCMTEDKSFIQGLRVDGNCLVQSTLKTTARRYQGIPTLFLDATAHPDVVRRRFPDVEFHSISVKSKDTINLYQLANDTVTKKSLKDEKKRMRIINGLRSLVKAYKNPGLITYKRLDGIDMNFDKYLADELGIDLYGHFGNLRGLNKFEDVDCLIILGRYVVNVGEMNGYTHAIFNQAMEMTSAEARSYLDCTVRMKDGSAMALNALQYTDDASKAIYDHFSLSETKQAIGRGRLVHGNPKDIYYLSNEYLGADIEITAFVTFDKLFPPLPIDAPWLDKVKEDGFIQDRQGSFADLKGLSLSSYKKRKSEIHQRLLDEGFDKVLVQYTKKDYKPGKGEYFVKDQEKLVKYLEEQGFSGISINPL